MKKLMPSPPPPPPPISVDAWTPEDEVRLLEAALEIATEPVESYDPSISLFSRLRRTLAGSFADEDLVAKIDDLKRRFDDSAGAVGAYYNDNTSAFEISNKIWGGAFFKASAAVVKCYTRKRKRKREDMSPNKSKTKPPPPPATAVSSQSQR